MLTQDGLKPILEIEAGDEVIGYVEATGETGSFPVTDTIHHTDPAIVLLTIDDETLETTAEHPFYTDDGVWVNTAELEVGEQIYSFSGVYGTVESVEVVTISQEMYNLTVDEAHTFFVGEGNWLVHNDGNNPPPTREWGWDLPKRVRSPKGIEGNFSGGYTYRIDTHLVRPGPNGENSFHIHVYDSKGTEVAKVNGWAQWSDHGGNRLLRPKEAPKQLRRDINRLVRHTQREMPVPRTRPSC